MNPFINILNLKVIQNQISKAQLVPSWNSSQLSVTLEGMKITKEYLINCGLQTQTCIRKSTTCLYIIGLRSKISFVKTFSLPKKLLYPMGIWLLTFIKVIFTYIKSLFNTYIRA